MRKKGLSEEPEKEAESRDGRSRKESRADEGDKKP